jgi:hypothetical protein
MNNGKFAIIPKGDPQGITMWVEGRNVDGPAYVRRVLTPGEARELAKALHLAADDHETIIPVRTADARVPA